MRSVMPMLLALGLATFVARAADAGNSLGKAIEDLALTDFRGRGVSLDDFSGRRLVVVAFLGTECPLARFYGPRLQKLSEKYADRGVAFVGINSNVQDSLAEMAAYARRHGITFPILKDVGSQVAARFGATRTPEIFVLDESRVIRYQGRVDGTFTFGSGVGLAKPRETRGDLAAAIREILDGIPVSVPVTETKGCLIGRAREAAEAPTVTYSKQIAPILRDHCVECHREGQIAPFAMDSYETVAGWGEMIAEVVHQQRMPPWHAAGPRGKLVNDARLDERDKQLIHGWVEQGCPLGDPADLPNPKQFHEGWFIDGGPDEVVFISEEPVPVKAEGVEDYRHYEVDPGFQEDKWVRLAECMPGNRQVVHHIIVFSRPPGGEPIPPGSTEAEIRDLRWLASFAPGTRPLEAPRGWARLVPAGHTLVFQMHYTPIGAPQTDRSSVGLVYMDEKEVTHVLHTESAMNGKFRIPPFASNHRVQSEHRFRRDTLVLSFFPHMHLRGKSFLYELVADDGAREVLLDVPRYDFNWQNHYVLAEPMAIPKGSTLRCTAHFDNSDDNLANPDPTQEIKWGPQSWDEMMIGFFDVGIPVRQAKTYLKKLEQAKSDRAH